MPAVSVVMPAYNGAAFIRETIASVLAQTMPDFEIVVVDDRSTDATAAVVAGIDDARVRLVRAERNGGPAVARCLAMRHATGRFIVGLDQDDLCVPTRFARQLAHLDAKPDHVLVTSTITTFGVGPDRADDHPELTDPDEIDWTMLLLNPLSWSSVMMRGEAVRALVPFERDERRFAEDFDLYHRIRAHGRIGRIAEPLVRYRLHPGGASSTYEAGMIASAGAVLAERYGTLFDGREAEVGQLMSRHVGAAYPPPDAATLAGIGAAMTRLIAVEGHRAPGFAVRSAARYWWRAARSGLRAGAYSMRQLDAARPAFAPGGGDRRHVARDGMVGAARRLVGRRAV